VVRLVLVLALESELEWQVDSEVKLEVDSAEAWAKK
jgi:hypothetical protein